MTGKTYVGAVLRRLRRERGLSQAELARRLGLSPSYVNQLEHDRRAASATVLARLESAFGVTVTPLDRGARARLVAGLREALGADGGPGAGPAGTDDEELAALAASLPGVARSVVALHRRYQDARARLTELAGAGGEPAGVREGLPHEQVRDYFYDRRHHIARLDRAAERLADRERLPVGDMAGPLAELLTRRLGITVEAGPSGRGPERHFDPGTRTLTLSPELSPGQRAFQLATQLCLTDPSQLAGLLDELVDGARVTGPDTRRLLRIGLASYFAGALLMPYGPFHAAAEETRYDVEVLARRFGVGFETVCHRLSTLQRPGALGVPFSFVRVDRAGNVSKRQSATDLHFSRSFGGCPRWIVYEAFARPGEILTQVAAMPDGRRYLWLAKVVRGRPQAYGRPRRVFAVGLGCELRHARRLVYAQGLELSDARLATPVGPGCRMCERVTCAQRAFPLVGRGLEVEENERTGIPYAPAPLPARDA